MNNKTIHILRRVVQLAGFLLCPWLFAATFAACGEILWLIVRDRQSWETLAAPIGILLVTFPATLLLGRFFCGWVCAFGSTEDFFWFIGRKLHLPEFHVTPAADDLLKKMKYIFFLLFVAIFWSGLYTIPNEASPWYAFVQITDILDWPGFDEAATLGGLILVVIMIMSMFIERFFCRYLCPMGAIFSPLSRLRILRIRKPMRKCGDCRICTENCPSGIQMHEINSVRGGECINCMQCLEVCPNHNSKTNIKTGFAIILSLLMICGFMLLNVSVFQTSKAQQELLREEPSYPVMHFGAEDTEHPQVALPITGGELHEAK